MKIELTTLVPILVLAGGIIFTYGQLTNQVTSLKEQVVSIEEYDDEWARVLTDQNMNRIIALEVKLDMAEKLLTEYSRQQ